MLAPKALGESFPEHVESQAAEVDGVAVVSVSGPLARKPGCGMMSYPEILDLVRAAAASQARTIVLRIDSPGGEVAGVLDTSRELRKIAESSGKRLLAYSDSTIASAAYAIACAAEQITISATACAGSIGVIEALVDATAADKAMGVQWTLVTSGKLKSTGNPHATLSDEGRAEVQQHVDDMAGEFFAWVKEARGYDPKPLEAAVFVGRRAVVAQVADRVMPWEDFLADVRAGALMGGAMPAEATEEEASTMSAKAESAAEEVRKMLTEMAESEDKIDSKRAKRALKALDAEADDADGDGDKDKKDEAKAESDEPKKEEPKKDEAKAESDDKEAKAVGALAIKVQAQEAELAAMRAEATKAKRDAIFAGRPDLSPDLVKTLSELSVDRVKAIVDAIPKGRTVPGQLARAAAQSGAGTQTPGMPQAAHDDLSVRMGLARPVHNGVEFDGNRGTLTLGAPVFDTKTLSALEAGKERG